MPTRLSVLENRYCWPDVATNSIWPTAIDSIISIIIICIIWSMIDISALGCIRLQKTRLFGVPKDMTQTCHRDMSDMSARRVATTPVLASSITPLRHVWKTCETCLEKTYLLILTLILHPIAHPSIQPPTQSPIQPPDLSINPLTNQPTTQPSNHTYNLPATQPLNPSTAHSTNQPTSQWTC